MSLFTHWACFDCRKSFARKPINEGEQSRTCPDCAKPMTDMGKFFAAPRRLNKKRWEVMKILAENGYKFQTEGSKYFIDKFVLGTKNPRKVKEIIEARKEEKIKTQQDQRIKIFKESKGKL